MDPKEAIVRVIAGGKIHRWQVQNAGAAGNVKKRPLPGHDVTRNIDGSAWQDPSLTPSPRPLLDEWFSRGGKRHIAANINGWQRDRWRRIVTGKPVGPGHGDRPPRRINAAENCCRIPTEGDTAQCISSDHSPPSENHIAP